MLREFKDNAHQRTKASLGRRPRLFFKVRKLIYQDKRSDQVVDASHDIVIEGVPRCANSFAVTAFRFAQPGSVKIAHHLHTPAQVLRGVELDLPCLVLVRNPRETIISHKALQAQNRLKGRSGSTVS